MKKKVLIGLGVLVVIVVALLATGSLKFSARIGREKIATPVQQEAPLPEGWGKYTSGEAGYSIMYPKDWNVQEDNDGGRRELLVLAPGARAFVRIFPYKDATLTSKETVEASIAEYKASFANKPNELLKEFVSNFDGTVGNYGVAGRMVMNNVVYQFLERGSLSTDGRVLIMRGAADASEKYTQAEFEAYTKDVKKIMDSFKIQ